MLIATRPTELPGLVGEPLGATDWLEIDQARVDAFAENTEDRQWIHVDPARAATSPFGGPIAHGFLSLSLLSHFLEQLLEVGGSQMLVNYGLDRVRFPAPVPVGSRLRGLGSLAAVTEVPGGYQLVLDITVEIEGATKPACVAAFVVRVLA